jgi:hypothetical protein
MLDTVTLNILQDDRRHPELQVISLWNAPPAILGGSDTTRGEAAPKSRRTEREYPQEEVGLYGPPRIGPWGRDSRFSNGLWGLTLIARVQIPF